MRQSRLVEYAVRRNRRLIAKIMGRVGAFAAKCYTGVVEEDHFVETAEGIVVEFDADGQPIGIEISDASRVLLQAIDRSDVVAMTA